MIKINNVYKKYNKQYVLKKINLSFLKVETTCIIGPSGSGKSTLLKIMNGLEKPTQGDIIISNNLDYTIGMVFQTFNLFNNFNVLNNLIYTPINVLGIPKSLAKEKAEKLLEEFKLKDNINTYPIALSGGQKQRVAICRALMVDPKIILFDEPTSALDLENIQDIINIISFLKKNITMIIITHHIAFAKMIADRIIFINQGLVLSDQPSIEFFEKPKSYRAKIFLEKII